MSETLDFWQQEVIRAKNSATVSANRVYTVFSFGFAGVLAIGGYGAVNGSLEVLAATPLAVLYLFGLVLRQSVESLYEAGFQYFAELQVKRILEEMGEQAPPIWRAGSREPKELMRFSLVGWVVGLVGLILIATVVYSRILQAPTPITVGCFVFFVLSFVTMLVLGKRTQSEVEKFLTNPTESVLSGLRSAKG